MPTRRSVSALIALLLAAASSQGKAYSLDDLLGLIKKKVAPTRVLTLAKQNCISFVMTPDVESVLRKNGATSDLVAGLKDVCGPAHPKPAVDTAPKVVPGAVPIPKAAEPPPPPVDTTVPVHIRAAVVNPDLSVRPLPQLDMIIITPKGDTVRASTDLEGKYDRSFKPGAYRIESNAEVSGVRYRWAFFVQFQKDASPIELTQKNAAIEVLTPPKDTSKAAAITAVAATILPPPPPPPPPKKDLTEREIFERDRPGLFTVYGVLRGTGFWADSAGLIFTNAHLVDGADEVRVLLDSVTKVYARVVAKDKSRDVAVLAVNAARCIKCPVLTLGGDSAHGGAPSPGDRVLAFGAPFNKTGVLSLGIVSNADASSVVSDVSIGYLNTGGPLVNKDGWVIALNTDQDASASGARVATSIAAPVLAGALGHARDSLPALATKPVSDELLPIVPRDPFPAEPIAAVSRLGSDLLLDNYKAEEGPFRIMMLTPQVMGWRQQQAVNALADKKKDDPKRYTQYTKIDPIQGWPDWSDVLQDRKAVILFDVSPSRAQFPFYEPDKIQNFSEGSCRDYRIYRDGVEIIPVEKVRTPAILNVEQMRAAGKNIALRCIYVYRIGDFAPRAVGSVAVYTVKITDGLTGKQFQLTLESKMIEQLGKDFTPYQFAR